VGEPVDVGDGLGEGDGLGAGVPGMSSPPPNIPQPESASDSAASDTKRDEIRYLVKKSLPGWAVWRCPQEYVALSDVANSAPLYRQMRREQRPVRIAIC
jgi:hypothetical protein